MRKSIERTKEARNSWRIESQLRITPVEFLALKEIILGVIGEGFQAIGKAWTRTKSRLFKRILYLLQFLQTFQYK